MKIAPVKNYWSLALVLLVSLSGCGLFSDFKKAQFDATQNQPVPLRVPKGFNKKEWTTDSAGFKTLTFFYGGGQELYFSTNGQLSPWIDTASHMPRPHLNGGIFYKGILPPLKLWREVYSQQLRYGYRNVPLHAVPDFDSALNYVRVY